MPVTLAYPTLAAPTTQVALGNVEELPSSRGRRVFQAQFETDAGVAVIYDHGTQARAWTMTLVTLTSIEKTALEDFFRLPLGAGGVNGRVGVWQLEDSLGNQYTVRFAQDVFEAILRRGVKWDVALTVQEVI